MPWCETCSKYWNPSSMNPDGSCPSCGRVLAAPSPPPGPVGDDEARAEGTEHGGPEPDEGGTPAATGSGTPWTADTLDLKQLAGGKEARAPWHFKLLVAALVIYLVWRLVELVLWIVK